MKKILFAIPAIILFLILAEIEKETRRYNIFIGDSIHLSNVKIIDETPTKLYVMTEHRAYIAVSKQGKKIVRK